MHGAWVQIFLIHHFWRGIYLFHDSSCPPPTQISNGSPITIFILNLNSIINLDLHHVFVLELSNDRYRSPRHTEMADHYLETGMTSKIWIFSFTRCSYHLFAILTWHQYECHPESTSWEKKSWLSWLESIMNHQSQVKSWVLTWSPKSVKSSHRISSQPSGVAWLAPRSNSAW